MNICVGFQNGFDNEIADQANGDYWSASVWMSLFVFPKSRLSFLTSCPRWPFIPRSHLQISLVLGFCSCKPHSDHNTNADVVNYRMAGRVSRPGNCRSVILDIFRNWWQLWFSQQPDDETESKFSRQCGRGSHPQVHLILADGELNSSNWNIQTDT